MNRPSKLLGAITLLCLLATQASGLHLHADEAGRNAGLHAAHTHHAHRVDHHDHDYHESGSHQGDLHAHPSSDHDHTQETDVSLFEQLNSSSYADPSSAPLDLPLSLPAVKWIEIHASAAANEFKYNPSRIHWRPLLRAPPHLV